MTIAMTLLRSPIVHAMTQALGWTLLHFLWQGVLVAVVLWCVLALTHRRSTEERYVAAFMALLTMLALPALTFVRLAQTEYKLALAQASTVIDGGTFVLNVGANATAVTWSAWLTARLDQAVPWVMLTWCAGVFFFSCRLGVGIAVARRLKLQGTVDVSGHLQSVFEVLRTRLGVERAVRLAHSAKVHAPTVIGWLKPVVLVPAACLAGMSPQQVEALLAHELAHVIRNDYLVSVFQSLVETVLFYHPAVWWVSRQVRREREYCCDELAVQVCGDRLAYARALSLLEERRALLPELALGANGGVLTMRIKRLLGCREEMAPSNMAWVIVLAIVIAGSGGIIGRLAYAEPKSVSAAAEQTAKAAVQNVQIMAQTAAADAEKQSADMEEQIADAREQSHEAERQLDRLHLDAAQRANDAHVWSVEDQKRLEEAQKSMQKALDQLNSDQFKKQLQEAQKKLNSPEFRKQMDAAMTAAKTVNSAEIRKQIDQAMKQLESSREMREKMQKDIQQQLNSPEFKKQMDAARATAEKANSPEFRAQMEEMRKKAAQFDTPEFREKMKQLAERGRKMDSPEFRAQMEAIRKKAAQFDTPEFREKMKHLTEQGRRVDSPEFRAQMEAMKKKAAQFDTPEFRQKMKELADQAGKVNSPELREKMNQMFAANGAPATEPEPRLAPALATGQETQPSPAPAPNSPVRVSGAVTSGMLISRVDPVYPQGAKDANIQGTVVLKAIIGKTGDVERLSVVSGPPELTQSAIDAVQQWKYKPYLLNGLPAEVVTTVNVNYTLDGSAPSPSPSQTPQASVEPSPGNRPMPKVIYKVDPEYTPEARAAKVQGPVVVHLTVNQQGLPTNVHVVRSLDLGLDQNAIAVVKQYRFEPAMKDGKPIEKEVNLEVQYRVF